LRIFSSYRYHYRR